MVDFSPLQRVRIVLCRPSHPGNVGAAARAMKTMGLADLHLVAPERFPAPEAQWMATHAADLLASARVHARLEDALADCVSAFAFSARSREWSPQVFSVREAAGTALERAAEGPVAFVFGNESTGLTNAELLASPYRVHIPADPQFGSLNLAQAVQVAAYELRMAAGLGVTDAAGVPAAARATLADIEGLYAHLDEAGIESGFFDPQDPKRLRDRWRRLFARVTLEREEVNILRGLLRALQRGGTKKREGRS